MKTSEFLGHLREQGVKLWTESGELRLKAPKGVLTPELRDELVARKQEILAVLASAAKPAPASASAGLSPSDPIDRVSRDGDLPLSFMQQRLWFLARLDPELCAYNIPMSWRLRGALDTAALEHAIREVVRRHEVLRSVFPDLDGRPRQAVLAPEAIELEHLDGLDAAALEAALTERAGTPFELATGPLFRPCLARVAEDEHVLFCLVHHIVFDGWSIDVFLNELKAHYSAHVGGGASPLDELPVQYADFASWQREVMQGPELDRQLGYWREQLGGELPVLELPFDHPRPAVQTYSGAKVRVPLSRELVDGLTQVAQGAGSTLFMALLAAYQVVLQRYSGLDDVIVASPIANRGKPELGGLLGFFANTLVLRTDLSGAPSFVELLARVRATCLGAFEHQDVPFEKLVDELAPQRTLSYTPLFQTMFMIEGGVGVRDSLGDVEIAPYELATSVARTELMVYAYHAGDDWSLWAEYNTDLFEAATVERLLAGLERVVEQVVARPEASIDELDVLAPEERAELVEGRNDTAAEIPAAPVHAQFEARVRETPEAVALVFPALDAEGSDTQLTYAELDAAANRLARELVARGVRPRSLVGLCLERSLEMVTAQLAILKAGAAYVPLDPAFPEDRVRYMTADAALAVIVTAEAQAGLFDGPELVLVDRDAAAIAAREDTSLELEVDARDRIYVIYTSGSTGRPKGVELEHRSVSNFLASIAREPGFAAGDRLLAVTTLSFDISVLELLLPLVVGGTTIVAPSAVVSDGAGLARLIDSARPDVMQATPATWRLLLVTGWEGAASLRIFSGGEALPRELADELLPRGAELWNLYGPTETTIWSTVCRVRDDDRPITVGRPIANTSLYVLDPHGRPVPQGVAGELFIGGDGLARGYLERPELTAERFVPDPFSRASGACMYRTGDRARWLATGELECLGRVDNQVKLRGFRIELGEIETVLADCDAVRECVAVVREDTPGDQRLVAYVVPAAADVELDPAPLREAARERLPGYMVPAGFVAVDALPLTPNGKVDRRALLERGPAPSGPSTDIQAPRNDLERRIADVWGPALGLAEVPVDSNFFDLGGHSLLLAEVHVKLQQALTQEVTIIELFQYPTIASLAAHLESHRADSPGTSTRVRKGRQTAAGRGSTRQRRRIRE